MDNRELADRLSTAVANVLAEGALAASGANFKDSGALHALNMLMTDNAFAIIAALRAAPAERERDNLLVGMNLLTEERLDEWQASLEKLGRELPAGSNVLVRMARSALRNLVTPAAGAGQGVEQEGSEATRSQPDAGASEDSQAWAGCHIHGKFYSGYAACPTCAAEKSAIAEGEPDAGAAEGLTGREDFEKWLGDVHMLNASFDAARNCYVEYAAHLAWKAWQEAHAAGWADAREAAAKVCEERFGHTGWHSFFHMAADRCADDIRALCQPSAGGGK